MPVPSTAGNFPDLLDPRFQEIFNDQYAQIPDRRGDFYQIVSGAEAPTRDTYRVSQVGAFSDVPEFTGSVVYDDVSEGYDTTFTHRQYASGFQIQRQLFDDDLTGIMEAKPRGMSQAYARTIQKHAAQMFVNAFSVDSTWQSGGDALALCSNAHTTRSGASTSVGFDNLSTAALSAVAVQAARIQMRGFRDDRANRISVKPDLLLVPIDLEPDAWEILNSQGKVDTANNNANFNFGAYKLIAWEYLSDVNDFWMIDSSMMKQFLFWVNRIPMQFAMVEDFDSLVGKWRLYERHSAGFSDWRWVLGHQVS